jgi:phosphate uptake regulator
MLKQENYQQHISAKFNEELESLRNQMLEMGGVVEQQLNAALDALVYLVRGLDVRHGRLEELGDQITQPD